MAETLAPPPHSEAEPRLRFKASDVRAMIDAGVLDDEQRYEVIDGEIVPMQAHNPPHLRVKRWLLDRLYRQLDETYWVDSEPTFYLEEDGDFVAPDILVYARNLEAHLVRGPDALLVIEVADKTIKKDRGRKARLYARFGVREYWVVNAASAATHVYRAPDGKAFTSEREAAPDETLKPMLLPQVRLRLADIG